jgi:hypothetical protein
MMFSYCWGPDDMNLKAAVAGRREPYRVNAAGVDLRERERVLWMHADMLCSLSRVNTSGIGRSTLK